MIATGRMIPSIQQSKSNSIVQMVLIPEQEKDSRNIFLKAFDMAIGYVQVSSQAVGGVGVDVSKHYGNVSIYV